HARSSRSWASRLMSSRSCPRSPDFGDLRQYRTARGGRPVTASVASWMSSAAIGGLLRVVLDAVALAQAVEGAAPPAQPPPPPGRSGRGGRRLGGGPLPPQQEVGEPGAQPPRLSAHRPAPSAGGPAFGGYTAHRRRRRPG